MPRSTTVSQLSLPGLSPVDNRGLFAHHFLEKRLPLLAGWKDDTDLAATFAALQALYQAKVALLDAAKNNEAQTEDDFVKPVLNALWTRDCYGVQVNLPNPDGRGQPDYALFTSQSARDGAEPLKGELRYWNEVAVVGDAKKWRDSLDKTRKTETPGAQIARYLFQTNTRWGILSNGPIWRLYEQDSARRGGVFYEVNLEGILQSGNLEDFKHFYFFFRREAFAPDASGQSFIEQVFKGSADYGTEVGEGLKEGVYDALRHLMNGFLDHASNALDRHDPAQLQRVHDTSLIVLYRLLFVLFAEDRGLLPCDNPVYKGRSLRKIHLEIKEKFRTGTAFLEDDEELWPRFSKLCQRIDKGLEDGGQVVIPAYNGGLFSTAKHPDIAPEEGAVRRWRLGDRALAQAIDRLAYARAKWDEPGREDIDYSSLEVQNLGSIYEGLLELQPKVAAVALVEAREGGKTLWKADDGSAPRNIGGQRPRRVGANEIYLATDKGERKASGSYYTPKYIVDYIVEQTVGPLAKGAAQKTATLWKKLKPEHERLQRLLQSGDVGARAPLEVLERALLAPYLELRVLDPAMGSGHFLVGAADYLSFAMATDPSLPHLTMMDDEDAQAFYKRLAVEHCLYGVDLNPLAVELAKLSLWLHTVSKNRALSFLDHHLHTGNSLIGASLDRDLNHEPPRLDARGRVQTLSTLYIPTKDVLQREQLGYFLDVFEQIGAVSSGQASDEHLKDQLYRDMDAARNRYRGVANLWLAPFFGVPVAAEFYQRAVQTLAGNEASWNDLTSEPTWQAAQEIAARKRFFHWHLEFPEAFLNADGLKPEAERGFDAVIGNPPYLLLQGTDLQEPFRALYPQVFSGSNDISHFFLARGVDWLKPGQPLSFVITRYWMEAHFTEGLRRVLTSEMKPLQIVDFGNIQIWPDISVLAIVCVFQKATSSSPTTRLFVADEKVFTKASDFLVAVSNQEANAIVLPPDSLDDKPWHLRGSQQSVLWQKVRDRSVALGTVTQNTKGIETGNNKAFTISPKTAQVWNIEKQLLIPVAEAENIRRYQVVAEDFVLYTDNDVDLQSYPNALSYLQQFKTTLDKRAENNLPGRSWWRLSRPRSRNIILSNERLLVPLYATSNRFVLTTERIVGMTDVYIIVSTSENDLAFLCAVLNSKLLNLYYTTFGKMKRAGYLEYSGVAIDSFPVPNIEFSTPADERAAALAEAQTLYAGAMASGDALALLAWVDGALESEPSRADCVHDLLAFLAGEMMRLNAAKHTEKNEFFEWLESFVGASIENLSQKTKVRAFEDADFEAFLAVLSANRARLSKDPQAREPRKSLKEEWTASTGNLAPHRLALARTDDWIDAVVYKLYGLSGDEIAVVRGDAPPGATST